MDLALSRHGVFALSELEQLGISRTGVRTRTARGRLHRVHQGVYSIVPTAMLTQDGRWLAAALACGPGAALSIRDATALYGLRGNGRHLIDVTVPGRSHRSRPGIDLHRSTTLRPEDVAIVRGIPVTSIARTVLDIAGVIPMDQLERVLEQAEVQGVLDERALREQIAHNHTRVGASRLATVLDGYQVDFGQVWTEFEVELRAALRAAGAPIPLANRHIVLDDGGPAIQPDLQWPGQLLTVEADGWKFHRSRSAFERNTRNDQRLITAGWQPIRVSYRQLRDERPRIVMLVVGQLFIRSSRRGAA